MPTRKEAEAAAKRNNRLPVASFLNDMAVADTMLVCSYFDQLEDEAAVWKEIRKLLELGKCDGFIWGVGDGDWGFARSVDPTLPSCFSPTELRDKLREMVKPPIPTVEEAAEAWSQLETADSENNRIVGAYFGKAKRD